MKPFEKYIKSLDSDKKIMQIYHNLRKCFQREGWTEDQLSSPPYYPQDIMRYFHEFSSEHERLFKELRNFFDIDHNEFADYIKREMKRIDEKTPLNINK